MVDVFSDVPAFIAAVEAGSFSAAAKQLNLSRSAVGKAIARLELRLSARLFQRSTRSQSLTDDGQAYYERCQRALRELQAGTALLESGRRNIAGTLRVSMPVLFGRLRVAPVLVRLAADHPDLILDLDFRDRHLDLVEAGIDLAIRNGPIGNGAGLMARRLARKRTVVCASPAYLKRCGRPSVLADLTQHEAVTYSRDGRVQAWLFPRESGGMDEVMPPSYLRMSDLGAILDAVEAGLGLAWLPDWLIADSLLAGTTVEVMPDVVSRSDDIHVIWPETPHLPTRVRAAIDALIAEFANPELIS